MVPAQYVSFLWFLPFDDVGDVVIQVDAEMFMAEGAA